MDRERDHKRKKDKRDDESPSTEKSKKRRSRSRSPGKRNDKDSRRKRRHPKSLSPDAPVKKEKQLENGTRYTESTKNAPERKKKDTDMLNTRTGGAYIPPARLRMMQAEITDKSSVAYQRLAWEALKKSIHGHINKINVGNIGIIIKQLLKENIVRGRGLLCRSVIQAQAASPTFTNVYAALVAAVNSRFPNIGELLLKRLVIQFKRGFKRNDKAICISSASFIAHLVNQRVAHEILALELLTLLVETPTDDSVEVAIAFLKECGQKLTEVSSKGVNAIFEMLRNILHEGQLDKRVQYMIEVMFQVWKDGFKDHPALIEELELVPEEEQFTHLLMLDEATDSQDILNVFKFDEKYEENEQKYKTLSKEILGSDAESEEEGSGESGSEESDDEEGDAEQKGGMTIIDNTETNLVALRRTIYLTINSSLDFEECAHKLMKMQLKPGQEVELCHMFLDCCAEQRTYEKFYGLLAQRFCNLNRMYIGPFEEIFKDSYSTAHRLDTNRLRNVSKFFAHLLFTDSISWEVLECVRLNEEDTTSSSRIYIKILFQELAEYMGLKKLNDRLKDPTLQDAFSGVFPRDNPKNTRFSINFFTSIGLGGLTDELREHLKQMPKNVPPPITEIKVGSSSDSSSSSSSSESSSSSDDSDSDSSSEEERSKKKKEKNKTNDKSSKNPSTSNTEQRDKNEDNERWGHDGFYDTYGQNARRVERPERDKDNFVIPRSIDRRTNRDREFIRNGNEKQRNQESDKRDERRRDLESESRRREGANNRDQRNKDESRSSRSDKRRETDDARDKDNYRNRSNKDSKNTYRRQSSDEDDSGYTTKEKKIQKNDREKGNSSDRKGSRYTDKSYEKEDSRTSNTSGNEDDRHYTRKDKKDKDSKRDHNKSSDAKDLNNYSKRAAKDKSSQKETLNSRDDVVEQEEEGTPPLNDVGWDKGREKSVNRSDEWDIRRSSSLSRETAVRYWDISGVSDERNRSERSSKSGNRRKDRS